MSGFQYPCERQANIPNCSDNLQYFVFVLASYCFLTVWRLAEKFASRLQRRESLGVEQGNASSQPAN
eukprot:scaffold23299_cov29-Prasinocladus_malaysianus.AAC.1